MKGKIIKSIAGFYEVHTGDNIYRCRARGVFRALGVKPLVGDDVEIEIDNDEICRKFAEYISKAARAAKLDKL